MDTTPADLNVYFNNNGSKIGSNSSPIFSSNTGYPSYMHYSMTLIISVSLNLTTCSLFYSLFFSVEVFS